jgi:4-amino-4-deoxy-L-arabinose transferase-like glycosyltransferase
LNDTTQNTPASHLPLYAILAAFVAIALIYLWATPPFEASDELWHFGMVQHVADTGQLPVQVVGMETAWEQEGSQPPLYYALAAVLVRGIDRSDFESVRQPNPHAQAGMPGVVGNKNLVLHDQQHPAWQGTRLAVYVVRLMSIALGVVTVCAVYAAARVFAPDMPNLALLAAGLSAFNPMFVFITASVNNDNLVTALNSLIIWQLLVMLRDGFSSRRSFIIAVLVALASLSKLSGLVLVPALILVAVWVAYRSRNVRGLVALGVLTASVWALAAGWWYLRNVMLYGELFGTAMMARVAGVRVEPFTFTTLLNEWEGFRIAYWGWFGAVNILTFPIFYVVMDVVTLLGVAGVILYMWRNRHHPDNLIRIVMNTLILILGIVGILAWTAQTYASQGRLLFPYITAIHTLVAIGLLTLWRRTYLLVILLALFTALVPFTHIAPAYNPTQPLATLPGNIRQVYARFENIELVAYQTPDTRYQAGDTTPITLYWRAVQPESRDLSLWLHAVDAEGDVIGKVDSFPGGGTLRTSTWTPGIYADTYAVPLAVDASGQFLLRVQVGWWDYATQTLIEPKDTDNNTLSSVMLDVGAFVSQDVVETLDGVTVLDRSARFSDLITLKAYSTTADTLSLVWEAVRVPTNDYTVFVQVLDTDGHVKGQGDAPPQLPTRYWQTGDQFTTHHTIHYPERLTSGSYRVIVGWYNPTDFTRLDTDSPDDAYTLTTFNLP